MAKINLDAEYILGEVKSANSSLDVLKDNISKLNREYKDILGNQKSDEFIKEFKESLGEIIEQAQGLADESAAGIIDSLEIVTQQYQETDEALSGSMKG